MNLVIVESPNKCAKIRSFLGSGWTVEASVGHIRKIPEDGTHVDEVTFEPEYAVEKGKADVVKKIKAAAAKADKIFLCTDPDREGEAISWHVMQILPASDRKKCVRAAFHEITKKAVNDAVAHPRELDMNLVTAQKARQVLDRLVGYKVSPAVWYAVARGTSAGRVQSAALRILCDRQAEIDAFKPEDYWYIDADLKCRAGAFSARVETKDRDNRYTDHAIVDKDLPALRKATYRIAKVERKEKRVGPYPPFDTVGLTVACSAAYGWGASKTMSAAQEAFEQGAITYHRTDSYVIASEALEETRAFIKSQYPDALPAKPNFFSKKSSAAAQEAHEAIRPTHVDQAGSDLQGDAKRLYDLVRARTVACQMTDMVVDTVTYAITTSSGHTLIARGQTIKERGWFAAYPYSKVKDEILPAAAEGEDLILLGIADSAHRTQPPPHYNDGSLVKRMEEDGIGRPSTRAAIIKALGEKGYVDKEGKSLAPTLLGRRVCGFLLPRFDDFFMDLRFTAGLEEDLDLIADGKKGYLDVVKPVYDTLIKKVAEARASTPKKEEVKAGAKCPVCKKGDVVEKESRFGKFFCCNAWPKCKAILVKNEDGTFAPKVKGAGGGSAEKSGKKCPDCGKEMLIRVNRKKGNKFLGCSGYPKCKHTEKIEGEE